MTDNNNLPDNSPGSSKAGVIYLPQRVGNIQMRSFRLTRRNDKKEIHGNFHGYNNIKMAVTDRHSDNTPAVSTNY